MQVNNNNNMQDFSNHNIERSFEKKAGDYDVQRMRDMFSKFEDNILINSNSHDAPPNSNINLSLPMFIIESFGKLFHMWKNSVPLKDGIKPSVFIEIHKDMNSYFENENQFDYICDTCEERISINDGTLRDSYEMHAQSDHHQRILDNYNYLLLNSMHASSNSEEIGEANLSRNIKMNGEILPIDDGYYCKLCVITLKNETEMINHFENWSHQLETMQLKPEELHDSSCVIHTFDNVYCKMCCIKLPKNQAVTDHLNSKHHKDLKDCYGVLKKDKNIVLLNRTNFEFMCTLCGIREFGKSKIVCHFHSPEHTNSKSSSNHNGCINGKVNSVFKTKSEKMPSENENFMKYETINDVIYLDGKCLLCNMSVNVAQFDNHCLESKHCSKKKSIEELARQFVHVNVNNISNDSPYNCEDKSNYFCNICLQSFHSAQLKMHETNKKHIRKFNLQKVLDSHRNCISVPLEGAGYYFCNLCEKSLCDDESCATHCASNAHTRLFDVLQKIANLILL